jgi:hypothetical protein
MNLLPDDLRPDEPIRGGVYGLWLRVTTDAVVSYLEYRSERARQFIFDPENQFFQMVCEQMGYETDAFRERIKVAGKLMRIVKAE